MHEMCIINMNEDGVESMVKRIFIILIFIILFAMAVVGVLKFNQNEESGEKAKKTEEKEETEKVDYNTPPKKANELLDEQKKTDEAIDKASEGSTLEDPYVNVDPYDRSPLTALIIFNTKEDATVSFTVKGKTSDVNISHTLDEERKRHVIPVVGLYPDTENEVNLIVTKENGEKVEKKVSIETEKLPDKLPEIEIIESDPSLMDNQTGTLNFAIPSTKHPYGYDKHGDIRWYGSMYNSHVLNEMENGHLMYLSKDDNGGPAYNRLFETDYLGKLYNAFQISEEAAETEGEGDEATLIHHDLAELPSGNLLLTVNDGEGEYVEDTMIEIERDSGEVVKKIDLKDLFPDTAYEDYGLEDEDEEEGEEVDEEDELVDWFHQNSVVYHEPDDSIIISGRHQDTVMKIDYETEEIEWILSAPDNWDEEMEQYLVEGTGDDFEYTGGQHNATVLPDQDDNPDTIDILVYDNNIHITHGENDKSKAYSGAIQYRINEKEKTAEVIWKYGEERGEELFTAIIGSAMYLPDTGNRLIGFGHVNKGENSHLVEVSDEEEGQVAFEARISDFPDSAWAYRGKRYTLYTDSWENNY